MPCGFPLPITHPHHPLRQNDGRITQLECPWCQVHFPRPKALRQHIVRMHFSLVSQIERFLGE
eukprot:3542089-Pyramimonas_sp.AAC.1